MANENDKSGITTVYGSALFETPPGELGWHHLFEPDEYMGKRSLDLNVHFAPDPMAALKAKLQAEVCVPLWGKFQEEALKKGGGDARKEAAIRKKLKEPDADVWVEDHSKFPSEKSKNTNPFLKFKRGYSFIDRKTDMEVVAEVKAWNIAGKLLDIPHNIARGSIVQVVCRAGLFMNALIPPQPSLQLVGIRILKLETWGGGEQQGPGSLADEEIAGLGEDFEADDLSAYVATAGSKAKSKAPVNEFAADDLDDEIPF